MPVFLYLLLAHFLIDWCWQTQFIAENKHKMWIIMFSHVAAWTLGICAVLAYFGLFAWWKLIFLAIVHWCEDLWKAERVARINKEGISNIYFQLSGFHVEKFEIWKHKYFSKLLLVDQSIHLIQLGVCLI